MQWRALRDSGRRGAHANRASHTARGSRGCPPDLAIDVRGGMIMARTFVRVLAGGMIGSSAMAEAAPDRSAPKSQRPILVSAVSDTTLRAQALSAAPAEEEAPESAVSSPPMSMDDPGTPGPNGIEVNFVGTVVRLGSGRATESLLDANYGIGDRIQLKFERPYLTEGGDGEPTQ